MGLPDFFGSPAPGQEAAHRTPSCSGCCGHYGRCGAGRRACARIRRGGGRCGKPRYQAVLPPPPSLPAGSLRAQRRYVRHPVRHPLTVCSLIQMLRDFKYFFSTTLGCSWAIHMRGVSATRWTRFVARPMPRCHCCSAVWQQCRPGGGTDFGCVVRLSIIVQRMHWCHLGKGKVP